jgi:tetratricopeptide (TPR) repeat protein
MYQQVIEADPDDYLSRIQLGVMKSWDKRFAEAVGVFKEVIAKKPPEEFEIGARLRLAEVLSWMKKFDESVAEYDKVIALAPKTAKAYLGKGEVLEWQGKYKPAIRVYEAGLQAAPGNSDLQGRLQQLMWVK